MASSILNKLNSAEIDSKVKSKTKPKPAITSLTKSVYSPRFIDYSNNLFGLLFQSINKICHDPIHDFSKQGVGASRMKIISGNLQKIAVSLSGCIYSNHLGGNPIDYDGIEPINIKTDFQLNKDDLNQSFLGYLERFFKPNANFSLNTKSEKLISLILPHFTSADNGVLISATEPLTQQVNFLLTIGSQLEIIKGYYLDSYYHLKKLQYIHGCIINASPKNFYSYIDKSLLPPRLCIIFFIQFLQDYNSSIPQQKSLLDNIIILLKKLNEQNITSESYKEKLKNFLKLIFIIDLKLREKLRRKIKINLNFIENEFKIFEKDYQDKQKEFDEINSNIEAIKSRTSSSLSNNQLKGGAPSNPNNIDSYDLSNSYLKSVKLLDRGITDYLMYSIGFINIPEDLKNSLKSSLSSYVSDQIEEMINNNQSTRNLKDVEFEIENLFSNDSGKLDESSRDSKLKFILDEFFKNQQLNEEEINILKDTNFIEGTDTTPKQAILNLFDQAFSRLFKLDTGVPLIDRKDLNMKGGFSAKSVLPIGNFKNSFDFNKFPDSFKNKNSLFDYGSNKESAIDLDDEGIIKDEPLNLKKQGPLISDNKKTVQNSKKIKKNISQKKKIIIQ
tara:strand:- start:226 stop:2070 length:1845 start_codon:yes stop_codon:yes gene_type:complete